MLLSIGACEGEIRHRFPDLHCMWLWQCFRLLWHHDKVTVCLGSRPIEDLCKRMAGGGRAQVELVNGVEESEKWVGSYLLVSTVEVGQQVW